MADVTLTITLKDAHVTRCLDAFNAQAGKEITLVVEAGQSSFWSYLPKQGGETNKTYSQRILCEFIRAFVRNYEYNLDHERYESDVKQIYENIDNVTDPSQNVPDNIVEA